MNDNSQLTRASIFARLSSSTVPEREQAWAEFRACYAPIIAGFAAKCGASRQDIDDIIQDVLTNFFSVSGEFIYDSTKGRFRGYLKTCTVRAAIRRAGKNVRFRGVPLDETSLNNVHQAKTRITQQLRDTVLRLRELEEA